MSFQKFNNYILIIPYKSKFYNILTNIINKFKIFNKKYINKFVFLYKKFILNYFYINSLPSVYKPSNLLILIIIILLLLCTIIFTNGFLISFKNYQWFNLPLTKIIVLLSIFYILYLIFNYFIRLYNVFFRSIIYLYYNRKSKINKFNINEDNNININTLFLYYYIYNIFYLVLTSFFIYKLFNYIKIYDSNLSQIVSSFTFIISFMFSLMYIDFKYNDINMFDDFNIKVKNTNKLNIFIQFIFIFILFFYSFYSLISFFEYLYFNHYINSKIFINNYFKFYLGNNINMSNENNSLNQKNFNTDNETVIVNNSVIKK